MTKTTGLRSFYHILLHLHPSNTLQNLLSGGRLFVVGRGEVSSTPASRLKLPVPIFTRCNAPRYSTACLNMRVHAYSLFGPSLAQGFILYPHSSAESIPVVGTVQASASWSLPSCGRLPPSLEIAPCSQQESHVYPLSRRFWSGRTYWIALWSRATGEREPSSPSHG